MSHTTEAISANLASVSESIRLLRISLVWRSLEICLAGNEVAIDAAHEFMQREFDVVLGVVHDGLHISRRCDDVLYLIRELESKYICPFAYALQEQSNMFTPNDGFNFPAHLTRLSLPMIYEIPTFMRFSH